MTEELFQKYIDGACGIQERRQVEEWLDKSSDQEKEIFLSNRWDLAREEFSFDQTTQLWDRIYGEITNHQDLKIKRWYVVPVKIWLAAACVMFMIASLYIITFKRNSITDKANGQLVQHKTIIKKDDLTTIVNNERESKKITLPDGSRVILFQRSVLQYSIHPEMDSRKIYLSGKAEFSVAKNKRKPFTVYSGEIATTAVGTRFEVSNEAGAGKIMVKLIEGIVSVRSTERELKGWVNNRLLYAGEEFLYEGGKASLHVFNQPEMAKSTIEKIETHPVGKELVFSHSPLTEVFEKMELLYQIKIGFQKEDLVNKYLTSTVKKEDEPASLLQAIAQMNELIITRTEEGFTVKRKEKEQ